VPPAPEEAAARRSPSPSVRSARTPRTPGGPSGRALATSCASTSTSCRRSRASPSTGPVETGKIAAIKEKQRRRGRLQRTGGAAALARGVGEPAVEHPQHAGRADLDARPHHRPDARRRGGLLDLRRHAQAGDRRHPPRRGEGGGDRRHRPAAPPADVGAFYAARVISADGEVSKPLTTLRGTHVSGGSAIWIVGDYEHMTASASGRSGSSRWRSGLLGRRPHHHAVEAEGPREAIRQALEIAGVAPEEIGGTWDLHATATPGDYQEVENLRGCCPSRCWSRRARAPSATAWGRAAASSSPPSTSATPRRALPDADPLPSSTPRSPGVHRRFVFDQAVPGARRLGRQAVDGCRRHQRLCALAPVAARIAGRSPLENPMSRFADLRNLPRRAHRGPRAVSPVPKKPAADTTAPRRRVGRRAPSTGGTAGAPPRRRPPAPP
jgi:hypothetical protein